MRRKENSCEEACKNDEEENEKQQDVIENRNRSQIEAMFPNNPDYQAYLINYNVRFHRGGLTKKLRKHVALDSED